jgi:HEPN domain-containing protein
MADSAMASLMLASARRDAEAYAALLPMSQIHDSILGFHAQQAIEKALKVVLFARGAIVPRSHDIATLLDFCADNHLPEPPHAQSLDELNPFAVQARYGAIDAGSLDRHTTLTWVRDTLAWAAHNTTG